MPRQLSLYLQVGEYLPARVHPACEHRAMTPEKGWNTTIHTILQTALSCIGARGRARMRFKPPD
jgi:hypothetical protein